MTSTHPPDLAARAVQIPAGGELLHGDLELPAQDAPLVLFAHGSGSSRHSSRNRMVAQRLHRAGIGTLLFDLLTEREALVDARTRKYRFDIDLLAQRMVDASAWAAAREDADPVPQGFFGASTGSAAALVAAARLGARVQAVVSRGGRPDLAGGALTLVTAATLLIVGGQDHGVLALNEQAFEHLHGVGQLVLVPGATHLFEEPGALEQVADLAAQWFASHLMRPAR
ncbi:alpha/beta hydrolase [Ramlibacter sp. AN1015]|uniref:dienelactone hydrolase family protein n=1 Tax=Ramlibacter sp. AN1015 TaxID=3133428 RepID=UPI0030BB3191